MHVSDDNWLRLSRLKLDISHCDKLDHVITHLLKEYKEYTDIKKYNKINNPRG